MNQLKKSNIKWLVTAIVFVTVTFLFVYRLLPYSDDDIRSSVVTVEHRYYYTVNANDTTLLYFNGISDDTLLINSSIDKKEVVEYSMGCWVNTLPLIPSCKGKIATLFARQDSCIYDTTFMRNVIKDELLIQMDSLAAFNHADTEIRYYIDTHSDNDEGYDNVIGYKEQLDREKIRVESIVNQLKRAVSAKSISIKKNEVFTVEYKDLNNNNVVKKCAIIPTTNVYGNTLIQTCDSITPDGVTPISMWHPIPFSIKNLKDTVYVVGRSFVNDNDMLNRDIEKIPEAISGDTLRTFPRLNIMSGSPIFTRSGIFIGILGGDTIINRTVIRKSL